MIRNRRDFYAGLMFMVIGGAFTVLAQQYKLGTAAKMGPGYFPTVLGIILFILGAIVLAGALKKKAPILKVDTFQFDVLGYILGAIILFGLALPHLGFVVSLAILILISARASHEFSWRVSIISVIVLAIASWAIFIKGIQLQMPVWPKFLGL